MDFAPYQDTAPETTRALSPPPKRSSSFSPTPRSPPRHAARVPSPYDPSYDDLPPSSHVRGNDQIESGRRDMDLFDTSLPLRLDWEAVMAYALLPPAGGVALLVLEHKSDYVRFHAWQSSLLFSALFVLHLLFSFSSILSWLLFALDMCLIVFLCFRAYYDASALDRFEVPFFGGLASSFVDNE